MIATGPAIPCPSCRRVLGSHVWRDAHSGRCSHCATEFEFFPFPALTAVAAQAKPQAVVATEESVCFFHAENRAEVVCDDCGRLLCSVCTINLSGRRTCPSCLATTRVEEKTQIVRERVLYDSLALALALGPLIMWPVTLVAGPAALIYVFLGWKKPGSLVRGPSRVRFVIAGVLAVLEIGGWVTFFTYLALKK